MRNKGRQSYRVLTINGRIAVWRIRWHNAQEGSSTPIDLLVDEAERTISQGVRELACRLNQSSFSFDKTAENLTRAAQVEMSGEFLRQVVETDGKAVVAAQKAGQLQPTWKAEDCQVEEAEGKTRVYLGCDGVTVPLVTDEEKQKRRKKIREERRRRGRKCKPLPRAKKGSELSYKEFRVVALYDEGNEHCQVVSTPGDHEVVGKLMQRESQRVGLHRADEKVANVDGAVWIRNELEFHGLVDQIGLDFYHLSDNVQKARSAVYGEAEEGKHWIEELMHCFKHEGYTAAWKRLTDWKASLEGSKEEAAKSLMHYVSERRAMIQYPEFIARGWQIGSGPTEALCKTTTKRLKGCSRRWDIDNAGAIMALACLEDSDAWDTYWSTPSPLLN